MDLKVQKMLAETVANANKNTVSPYTTTAKVTSITGDTVYVKIPGSENSTPVKARTASVKVGDIVDLSVSHSDTHITGNRSDVAVAQTTADAIASDVETNRLLLDNEIEMTGNKLNAVNNNINLINNNIDIQNTKIEAMNSTITTQDSKIEAIDSIITTHGSNIESLNSNVKIINSAFVIQNGKLTGLSEIVTGILDAGYVTTDLLNANVAWIENGKIKEGAIGTVEIADSSITTAKIKELSADTIKTGTLKTECLILTTDEVDPETGEKKVALITALNAKAKAGEGNVLDGAVIADDTITASKITVVDLKAFGATIGNFNIGTSSMYNGKTGLTDPTNGVYVGTDGIALGQGSLLDMTDDSPFRVESDGDFHLGGKDSNYINFDPFKGELKIDAKDFKIGSSSIATVENVSDAKNEAISEAASDATTKANTAKSDAISAVNETLKSYATLDVTNNKISSAVTETKAYTDAIQIGGRNLARQTAESKTWSSTSENGNDTWIGSDGGSGWLPKIQIEPNQAYTLSFDYTLQNCNDETIGIAIGAGTDGTNYTTDFWNLCASYKQYGGSMTSGHFVYNLSAKDSSEIGGGKYFAFRPIRRWGSEGDLTTPIILTISNFKLEAGNKHTDWTPAPEDVENDATTKANNAVTEAKSYVDQTAEFINATVQGVDGRLTTMEQNASGFTWSIDETAIVSSVNEYYKSTSATSLSGGSWSVSQPTWSEGTYIWMRTKNTNGKGTVSYTTEVCVTGNTGAKGDGLDVKDTRYDNRPPSWYITNYPLTTTMEFKDCATIGLSDPGQFCTLQTIIPWANDSGGYPKQTAKVEGNGKEYWRVGTSGSEWSSWVDPYGTAVDSAKTATNYMRMNFSGEGLTIGNLTESSLGKNVLIDSDSVDIRNGSKVLASYGENISLYKNGISAFTVKDSEFLNYAVSIESMFAAIAVDETNKYITATSPSSAPVTFRNGAYYKWKFTYKSKERFVVFTPSTTYSEVTQIVWREDESNVLYITNNNSSVTEPCVYLDENAVVDLILKGSVRICNSSDIHGKTKGAPPFSIGVDDGVHLEIDGDEITAKSDDTTPSTLRVNAEGGGVLINDNYNRSFKFQNGVLYAKKSSGSYAGKWIEIIDAYNDTYVTAFGYGNYVNNIGLTNIYGYKTNILSKGAVVLQSGNDLKLTVGDGANNISTNTNFVVSNNKGFIGTNKSGDLRDNLQPCDADNKCVIGRDSYSHKEGATNIYGDYLSLTTNNSYIMNNKAMSIPAISVYSVTTQTLGTSVAPIAVSNFNSTDNQSILGSTYFKITGSGVRCLLSGWIKVSAQISLTGLNTNDGVYLYIYKNSTEMYSTYARLNSSGELSIIDHVLKVEAGDTIQIYGRNITAARGIIANNWYGASLTIAYVN